MNKRNLRGPENESKASLSIHQKGIPVLLSSLVLRELGAGQVDMAVLEKSAGHNILRLFEIKSAGANQGALGEQWMSNSQKERLRKTAHWLAALLKYPVSLETVIIFKQNL